MHFREICGWLARFFGANTAIFSIIGFAWRLRRCGYQSGGREVERRRSAEFAPHCGRKARAATS